MADFSLIHLSDLHISSKKLSGTSKKLIADIIKQSEAIKKIIIVVSGDIVDKGEYEKYELGVIAFFKELKSGLGNKVCDIFIVPGNHDKKRYVSNTMYSKLSQLDDFEITEEVWNLQKDGYASYIKTINEIRKIFKKKICKETFGVEYCEIDNKVICAIEMDTTWGTFGGKHESVNLIVGQYQLNCLLEEYNSIKDKLSEDGKEISITIVIAHHPISWLKSDEEKIVKKYMIDEEYLNVDLFLCGHIHDMEVENWFNFEHSVMTLVTGIGWDHQITESKEKDKKDEHRYSIYILDAEKNSCSVIMRKTQRNGKFANDFSLYTNNESSATNLCYPVKIKNYQQPFIKLNAPKDSEIGNVLVDGKMLEIIKSLSLKLSIFQKQCIELLTYYKRNYLERLDDFYDDTSEEFQIAFRKLYDRFFTEHRVSADDDAIFQKDPSVTYELFTSFLQDVSCYFVDNFVTCFKENTNLRIHFRWYVENEDKYSQLCKYSSLEQGEGPVVSEIPWGGLIEQAYIKKKPLIFSVNPEYNNHEPVKWDDFMTVVPSFFKSELEFRSKENKRIKRPIMTFGISVLNPECPNSELSEILYILEYLEVDTIITSVIDDFMSCFVVDYSNYLTYIKGILDSSANKGDN